MPGRRRSAETMERDARAADLFRRGLSYRQIGAELGVSGHSAFEAVRRAAMDAARDSLANAEALTLMLERQQDYRRLVWRVATAKHYHVTQTGAMAKGPDGQPLIDDGPVLQAVDRLEKIDDMEAKLRGLYAAARSRVEVITEDAVDAELNRLAREIAEADHAGTPDRSPA
jgi:hypothetical protein